MSLDGYIDTLRTGGDFDSDGAFSLNQAEALQKLREYQVAKPGHFSTGLVASAIASKADWIRLETPAGDFRLEHNGKPISHHDLVNLFSSLLVGGPEESKAPVQELAFGLNALTALKPNLIRVTCSGPEELAVLEMDNRQLVVNRAEPYEGYGTKQRTVVQVRGVWRGAKKVLRQVPGMRPEISALKSRCRFATVPILWNENTFVPPPVPPKAVAVARLGEPPSLPFAWPSPRIESPGEHQAWIGICPTQDPDVTVVMHGLSFKLETDTHMPGLRVIVTSTNLRKDLSHAGLVRDKRLTALLEEIERTYRELIDSLAADWSEVPEEKRSATAHLLKEHAIEARQRWEALRADQLAKAARALGEDLIQ